MRNWLNVPGPASVWSISVHKEHKNNNINLPAEHYSGGLIPLIICFHIAARRQHTSWMWPTWQTWLCCRYFSHIWKANLTAFPQSRSYAHRACPVHNKFTRLDKTGNVQSNWPESPIYLLFTRSCAYPVNVDGHEICVFGDYFWKGGNLLVWMEIFFSTLFPKILVYILCRP